MSLTKPLPQAAIVIPNGLAFAFYADGATNTTNKIEVRGDVAIHLPTKSTASRPVAFVVKDDCGRPAYYQARAALNINRVDEDCQVVSNGSISVSIRIPADSESMDDSGGEDLQVAAQEMLRNAINEIIG